MAQWMDTVGDEDLKVQFYFNQQHPQSDVKVSAYIISTKPIRPFASSLRDVWFLDPPNEFHSQRFILRDRGIELEGQKLPNPGHAIPIPSSVVPHLSHLYLAILEYNLVMNLHSTREDWDKICKQDVFYVQRCEDYDSPIYSRVYMQGFLKPTCNLFSSENPTNPDFWKYMSATQWSLLHPRPEITLEDFMNCRLLPHVLGYGFAPRIAERYMLGDTDMKLWQEHVQPLQPEKINFVDIIGGDYLQVKFVYRPNGSVMVQVLTQKYRGNNFYPMFGRPGSSNPSSQKFYRFQGTVKEHQVVILNADAWRLALDFEMRGYGALEVRLSTFVQEEAQLPANAYHLIPLLYEAIYAYNIAMEKHESIQYGGNPEDRLYRRYSGTGGVIWCPYMPLISTEPLTESYLLKCEVESLKKRVAQLEKDCHIEFDDVPPEEEE